MIPFVTDDSINIYLAMTNTGSSGGIAYMPGDNIHKTYILSLMPGYRDTPG
jgi:hypothetical protein